MSYELIKQYLTELNSISILVRLALSVICGGVIGVDRGRKRRPAGLRTHILVCLGSALVMIVNQYLNIAYQTGDPARLGAQVISGIGFLGAGTIITKRNQVTGLTTAAGLWASACMGLAAGAGFYEGAVVACLFIYCVMTLLHRLDDAVIAKSPVVMVYVELADAGLSRLFEQFGDLGWSVSNIEIIHQEIPLESTTAAILTIRTFEKISHCEVLKEIGKFQNVLFATEV
ncbi:MgtC/SapB family protein [Oscillospiraceae bacterium PP1C4]